MIDSRRGMIGFLMAVTLMVPSSSKAGMLYDPGQYSSLGALSITAPGTYVISGTTLSVGTTIYTGVNVNGVAVFDFSSINIASGVTLTGAPGNSMPVALLSRSNADINGQINFSANGTIGGEGAGNTGVGGDGSIKYDLISNSFQLSGGGGGGFGGAGGAGGTNGTLAGGAGGNQTFYSYGSTLIGGSRGGNSGGGGGPGGGGGAIEVNALQTLTIGVSGAIYATGGNGLYGGGGSGGEIVVAGSSVLNYGTLDADGGMGAPGNLVGQSKYPGNGGGGGGVIFDYHGYSSGDFVSGTRSVHGGMGQTFGQDGANGLSYEGVYPFSVPEPSSLVLLGTSTLGLLGLAAYRRSRGLRTVR